MRSGARIPGGGVGKNVRARGGRSFTSVRARIILDAGLETTVQIEGGVV